MNERQKKFCDEYIISGNAASAARLAGYSTQNARQIGQRLLTNVDISAYITERLQSLETERTLTMQEALELLAYHARQKTKIVVTPKGQRIEVPVDGDVQVKALDLYFKINGSYREKTEPSGMKLFLESLKRIDEYDGNEPEALPIAQ